MISPVAVELATVSRGIEGVGCEFIERPCDLLSLNNLTPLKDAHVYGAYCLAYGSGTSGETFCSLLSYNNHTFSVGLIIGGQVVDHLSYHLYHLSDCRCLPCILGL